MSLNSFLVASVNPSSDSDTTSLPQQTENVTDFAVSDSSANSRVLDETRRQATVVLEGVRSPSPQQSAEHWPISGRHESNVSTVLSVRAPSTFHQAEPQLVPVADGQLMPTEGGAVTLPGMYRLKCSDPEDAERILLLSSTWPLKRSRAYHFPSCSHIASIRRMIP